MTEGQHKRMTGISVTSRQDRTRENYKGHTLCTRQYFDETGTQEKTKKTRNLDIKKERP